MNEDLRELLECLTSHGVEFLVIGAHAVAFCARPRMTEDINLWVGKAEQNANRLKFSLEEFGAPIGPEGARRFLENDRQMIRLGVPPNQVDLLNFGGSHPFDAVWDKRVSGELDGIEVQFPSNADLIDMKRVAGRAKDLADIESLTD